MNRKYVLSAALTALVAFAGCPTSSGGTNGGGSLECAVGNERSECPGNSSMHRMTALETLNAVDESVKAQFPNAIWMGGIMGINIDRGGKVMDQGPTVDILGTTMEYPTGWTIGYCSDKNAANGAGDTINLDTTKGECTGLRTCQIADCTKAPSYAFPTVDSPAAILAAFPSDPDGTLYSVSLTMGIGAYWSISREGAQAVKVDASTGAVIP